MLKISQQDTNSIILDSFAGSGTTALRCSKHEQNRRW
ncbi:MAG: hypothetical protein ACLTML_13145 [Blautia faecis]